MCLHLRGRRVVDLWGGIAVLTTGTPWAEDTLQHVFSTTKGFTAPAPTSWCSEATL
jgi:CubicO group peptidase (beta-lactamase class C family)